VLIMTSATPGVLYDVFLPRDPMLRAVPHPIYSHLTTLLTGRVFSLTAGARSSRNSTLPTLYRLSPRLFHAFHGTPRPASGMQFPHAAPRVPTQRCVRHVCIFPDVLRGPPSRTSLSRDVTSNLSISGNPLSTFFPQAYPNYRVRDRTGVG
jgi:hypothetical protein